MRSILLFVVTIVLIACQSNKEVESVSNSYWYDNAIVYEVFIQSYCDSNGDGIGDINGLRSKLDYIHSLGANAIWLMPIMPSPSYHKYDVTDYKAIHPDYGTMDDFKALVEDAHALGIKIIIDFIINHTSSEHPWFKEAASSKDSPFRDYYVWADRDSIKDQLAKKETSFDSDNIQQWHPVNGDTSNHEYYYGFFYGGMPDLNMDNPKVRKEIYDIGEFWIKEIGIDGLRMDAAKHIFPDDRVEDNIAFWNEFKATMKGFKSDVYIVGEVWANTEFQGRFANGFSSLFNFDLAFSILESVKKEKAVSAAISGHGWEVDSSKTFIDKLIEKQKAFAKENQEYFDATFLSNHDQNRYLSDLNGKIVKAKLAASIMFTLPGVPFIYYGEEIGMLGTKPDPNIREPFLWEDAKRDTSRTSWMEPTFSTDTTVQPLSGQLSNKNSIVNHYKRLIEFRKNYFPGQTTITSLNGLTSEVLMYRATNKAHQLLIFHNLSSAEQPLDTNYELEASQIVLGSVSNKENNHFKIGPFESVVFRMK